MKRIRRSVLVALLAFASACGGGGGGSSGGNPAPPGPPLPAVTLPATGVLPTGAPGVVYPAFTFAATGTAPFSWTLSAGVTPPGLGLAQDGVYSGTPLTSGNFSFTVMVTDANGSATRPISHVILASVPETEPNNTSGTADLLPDGVSGTGTLGGGDVDYWTFSATADDVIQIELFGTRRDFGSYDSGGSIPKLSVFAPDGTSFLVGHDVTAPIQAGVTTGWFHGVHDMDIPAFRIPTSGSYFLRIEPDIGPAGGAYAVRVASLLLGATQAESEANDDLASADAITPGVIRGFHDDDDLDFFSFDITSPTIVTFEIFGYRNGIGGVAGGVADDDYFDPEILIITPDGLSVVTGNDDVHFFDSKVSCLLGTNGTYFLLVQESQTVSAGDSEYVLTFEAADAPTLVESEPNDTTGDADPIDFDDVVSGFVDFDESASGLDDVDAFVFTGNAGDLVHVYWHDLGTNDQAAGFVDVVIFADGAPPTPIGQTISFWGVVGENATRAILPASGIYYVVVFPFDADTEYTFRMRRLKEGTFETTSNDTVATAEAMPSSGNAAGAIPVAGDVDVFSFPAAEGEVVVFSIYAGLPMVPPGSAAYTLDTFSATGELELLPDLEILNSGGAVLEATPAVSGTAFCTGEAIANGLATSGIAFVAPSTGTFYIRVSSNDGLVSAESLYFLERR